MNKQKSLRDVMTERVKYLGELTGLNLGIDMYTPGDKYGSRIRVVEVDPTNGGHRDFGQYTLGKENFLTNVNTMINILRVAKQKSEIQWQDQ